MAGMKRRTKYRKNVAQELEDMVELQENDLIVRVLGSRGGNLFDVESQDGVIALCRLPTRFRKMVWIKRGSYLVCVQAAEDVEVVKNKGKAKVLFAAKTVLMEHHLKQLRQNNQWPSKFMSDKDRKEAADRNQKSAAQHMKEDSVHHNDNTSSSADGLSAPGIDTTSQEINNKKEVIAMKENTNINCTPNAAAVTLVLGEEVVPVRNEGTECVSKTATAEERRAGLLERYQYEESSDDDDLLPQNRNRMCAPSSSDDESSSSESSSNSDE